MIPEKTLVVVATGAEAKFYRTSGSAGHLKLQEQGVLKPQHLNDDGPSGHRPKESSHQETDEATFAKQLGHHLNAEALAGKFEHIILIVDPGTLGELRPILNKAVNSRIHTQNHKTLIHQSLEQIAQAISKHEP